MFDCKLLLKRIIKQIKIYDRVFIKIEQKPAIIPQYSVENQVDVFSFSFVDRFYNSLGSVNFPDPREAMEECDFLPIIFDIIVGMLFPSNIINFIPKLFKHFSYLFLAFTESDDFEDTPGDDP